MAAGRIPPFDSLAATGAGAEEVLSPVEALFPAWKETFSLLFRPVVRRRWISLSVVCAFLGGGTTTAAFQWGLGALPIELRASEFFLHLRSLIARESGLVILVGALTLAFILGLVYARCVFRFVLIETVVKKDVVLASSWQSSTPYGNSYFRWLVAVVGVILVTACAFLFASYYHLAPAGQPIPWWVASLPLLVELAAVVFLGLLLAIVITLTDDLAAPLMYAHSFSLPAAWRILWRMWREDRATLLLYLVLRFAASLVISVGVLFVLFPALLGLSSAALIATAAGVFLLRLVGIGWAWNPITMVAGLGLFTLSLFALLSVVGMPGQVFLQNYGVRFMASRSAALANLCRAAAGRAAPR